MSIGRGFAAVCRARRFLRAAAVAIGCAPSLMACGGGISLDPAAWDLSHREKPDAADVLEAGVPDVSVDFDADRDGPEETEVATPSDVSDEVDASATPPDVAGDAHADETETSQPEAALDAIDVMSADSADAAEDANPDALLDADADADAGDGCTVACGWPDADYYVDARATSDGNGSKLEPFKTITRAIAAHRESAPGQAKTVYVAAGTYDRALGEQFPLVLRGLSLKGAGRDATFIVGTGLLDHAAEGGAFHGQYLVTLVAGDSALQTRISDVSVRSESPVPASNYYGVFCDRGSATGEVTPPAGETDLDRVTVGPGYQASVLATTSTVAAMSATTGCSIAIRSSVLTGGWAGVRAYGCDTLKISGPVIVEMGGPDPASGNVVSWMQAPNDGAAGASLEGCVLRASFQNNAFIDSVYGLSITDGNVATLGIRPFTIKNNSFERLSAGGIVASGYAVQIDELSDNRFVDITRAATQDPGPRAVALSVSLLRLGKVRRNQFIGNDFGVLLAVPRGAGTAADFGTADDPGGNVFRCNSALKETGADVAFNGDTYNPDTNWGGTVHFAGNAWDHAPPTPRTDDPIPNGCDISRIRVPNLNADLQNASLATAACPSERVPGQ